MFRNASGKTVEIEVSTKLASSELLARKFKDETVLGFDCEWKWDHKDGFARYKTLKERISMIQVASESRIGIFHLAQHAGTTCKELIAPTLKEIIEDDNIRKTGQSIMGDCWRLKSDYGLKPKGMFELSFLHKVIDPQEETTTQYVRGGLSRLVQIYFNGLALDKANSEMHLKWMEPMVGREGQARLDYAATDVYACVMLFWRMEDVRLGLRPSQPRPINACEYMEMSSSWPIKRRIRLEPPSREPTPEDDMLGDMSEGEAFAWELALEGVRSVTPEGKRVEITPIKSPSPAGTATRHEMPPTESKPKARLEEQASVSLITPPSTAEPMISTKSSSNNTMPAALPEGEKAGVVDN